MKLQLFTKPQLRMLTTKITARSGDFSDIITYFNSNNINSTKLRYEDEIYTPLQLAILCNKSFLVRDFLQIGADTSNIAEVCKYITDHDIVTLLIDNGVDFNSFTYEMKYRDERGTVGFYTYTLFSNDNRSKNFLIYELDKLGIKPREDDFITPLEASIFGENSLAIIRHCLENSYPHMPPKFKDIPVEFLLKRAMVFDVDYVEMLAGYIDINSTNKHGDTALHRAIHFAFMDEDDPVAQVRMVGKLIALGADVNAKNNLGVTPLLLATQFDDGMRDADFIVNGLIQDLIEAGASVEESIEIAVSLEFPDRDIQLLRKYI